MITSGVKFSWGWLGSRVGVGCSVGELEGDGCKVGLGKGKFVGVTVEFSGSI